MLFALVVMGAAVLLVTMIFNNRRQPSRWDGGSGTGDGSAWSYGGGADSGSDCGADSGGGGGDCGGGGGGD